MHSSQRTINKNHILQLVIFTYELNIIYSTYHSINLHQFNLPRALVLSRPTRPNQQNQGQNGLNRPYFAGYDQIALIMYVVRRQLIITTIITACVLYKIIILIFYFGFTGGITVGVIIPFCARFAFIKRLIYLY